MDKKEEIIVQISGTPLGVNEKGQLQLSDEIGKIIFDKQTKKKVVGRGGRPKGQWPKAYRRYCAIGKMFEAKKRLSRETNRAIAGYIFMDLEQNPNKNLGEKKNPYLSAEGVYDIIKRRKWEKPYRVK